MTLAEREQENTRPSCQPMGLFLSDLRSKDPAKTVGALSVHGQESESHTPGLDGQNPIQARAHHLADTER